MLTTSGCAVGWNLGPWGTEEWQSGMEGVVALPHSEPGDPFGQLVAPGWVSAVVGSNAPSVFWSIETTRKSGHLQKPPTTSHIPSLEHRFLPPNAMLMISQRVPISSSHFSVALQST